MNNHSPKPDHPTRSSSLYPDDVSPPDSPPMNNGDKTRGGRSSPDISPISDTSSLVQDRSPPLASNRFNSNLPVPKTTRKFWNRPSVQSPEQGASLTHWDVYSGEPTTSERGKPPSTTPSAVRLIAEPTPGKLSDGFGTSTHISGGTTPIGRKRVASRDSNNATIVRPEWKGAGGRHKIVTPPADKPLPPGKAPTFPAGREKQQQENNERERAVENRALASSLTPKPLNLRRIKQTIQPSIVLDNKAIEQHTSSPEYKSDDTPRNHTSPAIEEITQHNIQFLLLLERRSTLARNPSPEYKSDDTPMNFTPPAIKEIKQHHSPGLAPEDRRSPLARNPSNEEMQDNRTTKAEEIRTQTPPVVPQSDTIRSTHEPFGQEADDQSFRTMVIVAQNEPNDHPASKDTEDKFRAGLQHMNLQDEPRSRFSATTYATTVHDSPPDTPVIGSESPAMPTPPSSILNRKRPVPPAGLPNSRVAARKPTSTESSPPTQAQETRRKALPKSPPEKAAVSRVEGLSAKLDNLRRRRGNLQTVIYELTHVVQPSSIAYDMASRAEIKRTVEGLNKELADVIKDEHETGLKLHRAMKREDEFGLYEPTSIWVRRVTT